MFEVDARVKLSPWALKSRSTDLYPPGLVFRVVGRELRDGRARTGAKSDPFPGYPQGVERWDYDEGWELA